MVLLLLIPVGEARFDPYEIQYATATGAGVLRVQVSYPENINLGDLFWVSVTGSFFGGGTTNVVIQEPTTWDYLGCVFQGRVFANATTNGLSATVAVGLRMVDDSCSIRFVVEGRDAGATTQAVVQPTLALVTDDLAIFGVPEIILPEIQILTWLLIVALAAWVLSVRHPVGVYLGMGLFIFSIFWAVVSFDGLHPLFTVFAVLLGIVGFLYAATTKRDH